MKTLPTGFTCLTVDKCCPWFTVGENYAAIYEDHGVFIKDDEWDEVKWKLTKVDGIWSIEINNHMPRIVATFNELESEE